MRSVVFCTTNDYKFAEMQTTLADYGVTVERGSISIVEIQSDDVVSVCTDKAKRAYAALAPRSVIVDDAGLFIPQLGGFPGTMTSQTMKTIGGIGLSKLCEQGTVAQLISVVTYYDGERLISGKGVIDGRMDFSTHPTAASTLVSDLFIPDGQAASLTLLTKEGFMSHRRLAITNLMQQMKGI